MSPRVSTSLLAMLLLSPLGRHARADEPASPEAAQPPGQAASPGEKPAETTPARPAEPTSAAPGATDSKDEEEPKPKPGELEQATFGGGCFWCMEAVFQRVRGVRMVVSGYSGGLVPFPSYQMVQSGMTGHAEVIQVTFEPAVISYEKLLELFWRSHDPTTPNAQGPDVGTQYRSIILYHNERQKKAIARVYRELKGRRVLRGNVVTQVVPFRAFFPAEAYHQNYYNNHPFDPYSLIHIEPKFDVLRKVIGRPRPSPKARAKTKAPSK